MNINIAHLYYDLMNLYGENGNVKALIYSLEKQGINVSLERLSVDDKIDFEKYDCFIIGSGTESNILRCLQNLRMYKDSVKKAIENGKFFLCTGNSFEMFGKVITDISGSLYNGLNIFDYSSTQTTDRLVGEVLFKCPLISKNIIGFQNQGSKIEDYDFNLFEVIRGIGSHIESKNEGINYKNFYGTYVIGPLFVRNPEFLKYFITNLIKSKDESFEIKPFNLELDEKAYDEFMNNHYPAYNIKKDF